MIDIDRKQFSIINRQICLQVVSEGGGITGTKLIRTGPSPITGQVYD